MIAPGNNIAILMMLIWPIVTLIIFRATSFERAIVWSLLGAALVLPVLTEIDLPGVNVNKDILSIFMTFFVVVMGHKKGYLRLPKTSAIRFLIYVALAIPILTMLTNTEPQVGIERTRPGLTPVELIGMLTEWGIQILAFILGYCFLNTVEMHKTILRILVVSGLVYVLIVVYETRMSPHIHSRLYGYFPHDWLQQLREGGWRSVGFLGHGLLVSMFMMISATAAATLYREKSNVWVLPPLITLLILLGALVLNKSWAPIIYGAGTVSLIIFFSTRFQIKIAWLLVLFALSFPILRGGDFLPVDAAVELVAPINEQRASSLSARFENEEILLNWANRKPIFGWGTWGRNRPMTEDGIFLEVVSDGAWIITLGKYGWLGYLTLIGLFGLPVFYTLKTARLSAEDIRASACLAILIAIILVDQLPNSSMRPWMLLFSGALVGLYEAKKNATAAKIQNPHRLKATG